MTATDVTNPLAEAHARVRAAQARADELRAMAAAGKVVKALDLAAADADLELAKAPIPTLEAEAAVQAEANRKKILAEAVEAYRQAEPAAVKVYLGAVRKLQEARAAVNEAIAAHGAVVAQLASIAGVYGTPDVVGEPVRLNRHSPLAILDGDGYRVVRTLNDPAYRTELETYATKEEQ